MPTCKKCTKIFPGTVIIGNKKEYLHRRSYCLECSPHGSNKGYEYRKENSRKYKGQKIKGQKICPICKNEKSWNKNNVCSTCRTMYSRYKNRVKAIRFLGGKCICGNDDPDVLTFHHFQANEKCFEISDILHKSWLTIESEAKKCILLCSNCHMKQHKKNNHFCKIVDYIDNLKTE